MWKLILILGILLVFTWATLSPPSNPYWDTLIHVSPNKTFNQSQFQPLDSLTKMEIQQYFYQAYLASLSDEGSDGYYIGGGSYRSRGYYGGYSGGK